MDLFNNVYKNKKVLITGDTGFKGSWLCIWLKELGANVYGYALPPLTNQDNFVTANLDSKIHHVDGDIRDKEKLANYFNQVKPAISFHLAAQPLVIESYNNPHYNFETNVMGTVNFFETVRNCTSVKAAINVTTDKCYQNIEQLIGYTEEDKMGGDDPYSASKGCSELITNSYLKSFFSKENTASIASARAGNVIGGGDWADNRILPDMMRSFKNKEVSIIRNPQSVRPWQFVLEPLFGYLKLGEMLLSNGKSFSGGWNFGPIPNKTYTVKVVVNEVKKIIPSLKTALSPAKEKLHEAKLLQLNIDKAVNKLGWKPKLNFEETMRFTLDGYLQELENKNIYQARVEQIKAYCAK
ncbi:MAG: CDP-glucose 4,6-dehydratase [Bacteroidia bacterium]